MGDARKTADPSSTLAAEGAVDFYGTLFLGDGQPPSTMGSAGTKGRAKLVMSLLDPLCTAEEKIVLKTPTK